MARVVAHVPDLLFGSKVEGMLRAAGHDVALVGDEAGARAAAAGIQVLVVDLFFEPDAGIAMVADLKDDGTLGDARVLGAYETMPSGELQRHSISYAEELRPLELTSR